VQTIGAEGNKFPVYTMVYTAKFGHSYLHKTGIMFPTEAARAFLIEKLIL
jgi:hypothetical protein